MRGGNSQNLGKSAGLSKCSDLELIRATLQRKQQGQRQYPEFREFIGRYETKMYSYVVRRLGDSDSVYDVLQDAKYKMFRSGLFPEYSKSPVAYYMTVVKRCLLDTYKYRDRHSHESMDQDPLEDKDSSSRYAIQYAADESWQPDYRLPVKKRRDVIPRVLDEAFRRLSAKSSRKARTVAILKQRFLEKRSVKDIARQMGISKPNTVSQIISRGLVELEKTLNSLRMERFPGIDYMYEHLVED